jgi:hypothetical protein
MRPSYVRKPPHTKSMSIGAITQHLWQLHFCHPHNQAPMLAVFESTYPRFFTPYVRWWLICGCFRWVCILWDLVFPRHVATPHSADRMADFNHMMKTSRGMGSSSSSVSAGDNRHGAPTEMGAFPGRSTPFGGVSMALPGQVRSEVSHLG